MTLTYRACPFPGCGAELDPDGTCFMAPHEPPDVEPYELAEPQAETPARESRASAGQPLPPAEEWEEPLPLGWQTRLPAFPLDVLPGLAGQYAAALSVETQTPTDLAGVVVLGTLAACIGGRVRVSIRRGWIEPTNTYTVPVLAPGSRKSAVVAACEAPLDSAEKALLEEMAERIRNAMIERDIKERFAEQLKQKAGKNPDPVAIMEAQEAARVAADVEVPAWPRLLTDDATPEQLVKLMADQGGRIAAITAEAGIFDSLAGRYTARINLEPMLKAHAGDSIRVDRRSRDPERVDRPALTMIATIQPYALRDMVGRPEFAGRGLLARVLWCLPADKVGHRDADAAPVPETLTAKYRKFVEDLAVTMAGRRTEVLLTLSEQAYKVLIDYLRRVEAMLRPEGPLGTSRLIKDWGSKLVGAVARIAGALHVAAADDALDALDQPISEEVMVAAVQLGEYFRAHATAALSPEEDGRVTAGRKVIDVLLAKEMHSFTLRELTRRMPRAQQSATELTKVLKYLTELGWTKTADKGWDLHPRAAEILRTADTADTADSADSADSEGVYAGQEASSSVSSRADSADTVSAVSTGADSCRAGRDRR